MPGRNSFARQRVSAEFILLVALMAFFTFTVVASLIHEMGHVFWTLVFGGSISGMQFSWFWGDTFLAGNFVQWQLFIVYSGGTMFVTFFMIFLILYPEPLYTNIAATVLGFRNLIDGFPLMAGTDGFQMAKISSVGAWAWYALLFIVWAVAISYASGFRISWKDTERFGRRKSGVKHK